jgi:hypothetical protein
MKRKLTTLLIASMFIIGCKNDYEIIESKYKTQEFRTAKLLNPCICEYHTNWRRFLDSCNKYSVGDTITFKK